MEESSQVLTVAHEIFDSGTRVLELFGDARTSGLPEDAVRGLIDAADLHHLRTGLDSISNDLPAETSFSRLRYACKVLAADLGLRLDLSLSEDSRDVLERVWSTDTLSALANRLNWLRGELHGSDEGQAGDASRVPWTGPGTQDRQRFASDHYDDHHLQNPLTSHWREIDPSLKRQVDKTLQNADKTELLQGFFLESLAFPSMSDREDEVSAAHRRTFEWILAEDPSAPPQHDFVPWLKGSDRGQIYWINGKAGSGKSTLLRFIANHERTEMCLREWAGSAPLAMLNFFFWTGGSVLQRSQTGLLRSLLYQLLQQLPELTAWTFPDLWLACQDTKKRVSMLKGWEHSALLCGLHVALELAAQTTRICLFIDGLDEFEGREDTVIELVREVVGISGNIKACVSSRPWPAFERAFNNAPQILLQELTGRDIERFVEDQLRENEATHGLTLKSSGEAMERFKATVLKEANGAFLWTSLALRWVTRAVSETDTIETLSEALLRIPSDLNDLFCFLLFQERSRDALAEQSRILQTLRARDQVCDFTGDDSVRSISLYQMALAFDGGLESTQLPIRQRDQQEALELCEAFADLLADSCAGLIVLSSQDKTQARVRSRFQDQNHVESSALRRVHYLHRTVRDFFAYSGVWRTILKNIDDDSFDPHLSLLRSHVRRLRSPLQKPEQHRRLDEWWHDDVVLAMTHARFSGPTTAASQIVLLDTLNETFQSLWRKRATDPLDTWARHAFGSYEEREKHKTPFHHAFLSLGAKFGLAEYLRLKLKSGEFGYQGGTPLLSHALEFLVSRRQTVYPLSEPAVIRVLLENGEDPNLQYKTLAARDETPWLLAVKNLREGKRRGWIRPFDTDPQGTGRWVKILETMLEFKADADAVILEDQWDPKVSVVGVVQDVAYSYCAADICALKNMMDGRKRC